MNATDFLQCVVLRLARSYARSEAPTAPTNFTVQSFDKSELKEDGPVCSIVANFQNGARIRIAAWFEDQPVEDFDFGAASTERGQKIVFGKSLVAKEDVVLGGFRICRAPTYKRLARYRLARAHTDAAGGVYGAKGVCFPPAVISSSQSGAGGKHTPYTPNTPSTPSELADVCCVCGADVAYYGPDGRAYCAAHEPRGACA